MGNLIGNRVIVLTVILALMVMTRGSHFLTELNLPDMSLILFLILGFFIPSLTLFFTLFFVGALIDFGSAVFDVSKGFLLNRWLLGPDPHVCNSFLFRLFIKEQKFISTSEFLRSYSINFHHFCLYHFNKYLLYFLRAIWKS